MIRDRNTKIVATLGPASSSPSKIHSLFKAGADIFRLNFSHGSHLDHRKRVYHIRQYEKRIGRPIAILGDLQGPKIRIGKFAKQNITLKNSQKFILDLDNKLGDEKRVFLPHPEIFNSVKKNSKILIDDGKIKLNINKVSANSIESEVIYGGKISDNKGVNIPESFVKVSPITKKDYLDLELCLDLSLDYVALSFVQKVENLTFPEAIEFLANRFGIQIRYAENALGTKHTYRKSIKSDLYNVNELAMSWFAEQFNQDDDDSKVAKDYWLTERRFSLEDAKTFGIGYAPVDRFSLGKYLEKKGITEKVLSKSGLFNEKKQSGQFASRFCGRLMIPIREKIGRVCGFTARQLAMTPSWGDRPRSRHPTLSAL